MKFTKSALPRMAASHFVGLLSLAILNVCLADLVLANPAQSVPATTQQPVPNSTEFWLNTISFIMFGFFVYYFMVIKPMFDKEQKQKKFIENLKKNEIVQTTGGIIGKVMSIDADAITIESVPGTKLKIAPAHIIIAASESTNSAAKKA
ncbi:preprotein translocase subunit YajC [bacterium]|nr:preprotein translocase subunit YajC [bacterium]